MSDTRIVPRKQLEQRMSTQARDIRRLKADVLTPAEMPFTMGGFTFSESTNTMLITPASPTGAGDDVVQIPTGSSTPKGLHILESTGATNRASMLLGDWEVGQDFASGGTRDFFIYYGGSGLGALIANTGSDVYFRHTPQTPSLTARRGATGVTGSFSFREFSKFGRRIVGSARYAYTDASSATNGLIDFTYTGLGSPPNSGPVGTGFYWDNSLGNLIPLHVFLDVGVSRFIFHSSARETGNVYLGQAGAQDNAIADDLNSDWLSFSFNFVTNTDF